MLDLVMFVVVGIFFIFLSYRLLSDINNNKKFDLLIVFAIFFLCVGRLLELVFIANISSVEWSFFPAHEENESIIIFGKLPWLFFNFSQTFYNMYWFTARYLVSIVLVRAFFRLNRNQYENVKRVIFYNFLLVVSAVFFWLNYNSEASFDKDYASYFFIGALISYVIFIYFVLIKKTILQTSLGVIILVCFNLYFLFTRESQDLSGLLLVEIGAGLIILFIETFKKIRPRKTPDTARVERVNKMADLRISSFQRSNRNLINEINSKFRKN